MMEFEYSPRHSPGNAVYLLSPVHAHGGGTIDGYASIQQIRRSLARSPSKPARYSIPVTRAASTSPTTSPSAFTFSRTHHTGLATEPIPRPKYTLKRTGPARSLPRRTSPNSPLRRALGDTTSQANANLQASRRRSLDTDQENMDCSGEPSQSHSKPHSEDAELDFLKPDKYLQAIRSENISPAKSSPLKRSDGVMNLEMASSESSRVKRRSLHGASLGTDFNVFDQGLDGAHSDSTDLSGEREAQSGVSLLPTASSPIANSPQRRPLSLRKSTLQQRAAPSRPKHSTDGIRDATLSPSLTRARSRISLDSALPLRSFDAESPFRRAGANEPPVLFAPPAQRPYQSAPKSYPHPLSHALTPSSSAATVHDDESQSSQHSVSTALHSTAPAFPPSFSKSLPIGAMRPSDSQSSQASSQGSYATPAGYKMAKPLPQAFMSTGLISKRNRNMDMQSASLFSSVNMPDTPSKKAHVIIAASPATSSTLGGLYQTTHEFGSPSTPFNGRISKMSPEALGKGANIFGSRVGAPQLTRRGSFLSIDEDTNESPTHKLQSQSSNEDLPPTPTKSNSTNARPQSKGKSNSLRSSLFGRRTSMSVDTFASPGDVEDAAEEAINKSPVDRQERRQKESPHTPHESFTPPDPSNLTISAERRLTTALGSSMSFPPATPTGPRDNLFNSSLGLANASSSYFSNDVDTALSSRFAQVTTLGIGEFSQVYRVENMVGGNARNLLTSAGNVWAVKKSRRPYAGNKDRQRKMREVQILKALRGNEHVVELVDEWESKNHLYIQLEFCENGNLKDFLTQTGFKGRLDDFRIWKILLELCQGVKSIHDANFIHLDLKPANVLIDWGGVLKIGDFGLASSWPAPAGLDGEGDREYIGPEVLSGRFDKPADVFSLGMIMLEIAGNIILPDNGTSWQRLRAGDMSDLPSLTWSSDNSLVRDESGDPVEMMKGTSTDSLCVSDAGDDDLSFLRPASPPKTERSGDLVKPPNFMVDPHDAEALERVVQGMICPDPERRPDIDRLLAAGGVQWVERRRRAGATVYEGNWGPADNVLNHQQDVEMMDI